MNETQNQQKTAPTLKSQTLTAGTLGNTGQAQSKPRAATKLPPHLEAPASKEATQAQFIVAPQPLKIDIDTPTDWPAVLAPFVLGAAAFYFTKSNQTQQIRSSTANYRNEWLKEVRAAAIEFSSKAIEFQLRLLHNADFARTQKDDARTLLTAMLKAQSTLVLMLDAKQAYKQTITDLMDVVVMHIEETGDGMDKAGRAIQDFDKKTHLVLEKAWQDIKKDLGHKRGISHRISTWVRSFFNNGS